MVVTRFSPLNKGLMKLIGNTVNHSEKDHQKYSVCEEELPGRHHRKPHEEIIRNSLMFEKI